VKLKDLEKLFKKIYGSSWRKRYMPRYEGEESAKLTKEEIKKLFSKEEVENE